MTIGSGIAVGGWFIAFAYACSVSENTVAGVVIAGMIVAVVQLIRSV